MKRSRLGDILLRKKAITEDQLHTVMREMKMNGVSLISELVKQDIFNELQLTQFIGKSFGRPVIDLSKVDVSKNIKQANVSSISVDMMQERKRFPLVVRVIRLHWQWLILMILMAWMRWRL